MAAQDLSAGEFNASQAEEQARRQQALLAEFPQGRAPYTRGNLIAFGFWGGIAGAGIAGIVNLRRSNQSQSIPGLLLITLVVLLIEQVVWNVVEDNLILNGVALDQNGALLISNGLYVLAGMALAWWIAGRQRALSARWLELAQPPRWKDQGGCLLAIGWVVVAIIIAAIVITVINPVIGPATLQVTLPAQTYSTQGVSVSIPAGWASIAPEKLNTNCTTSGVTCLATVQDGWSGSTMLLRIVSSPGITPEAFASEVLDSTRSRNPALPNLTPQPYSAPALTNRDAVTVSGSLNDVDFILTVIADGDSVLSFTLNCSSDLQASCPALRDQIVSTFKISSAPAPESTPGNGSLVQ